MPAVINGPDPEILEWIDRAAAMFAVEYKEQLGFRAVFTGKIVKHIYGDGISRRYIEINKIQDYIIVVSDLCG